MPRSAIAAPSPLTLPKPRPGPAHARGGTVTGPYARPVIDALDAAALVVHRTGAEPTAVQWSPTATVGDVTVATVTTADGWDWTLHVDRPTSLDAVAIEWDAGPVGPDPRVLVQGWQSWSPLGWRRLGVDHDPSRGGAIDFLRSVHHPDPALCGPFALRSEMVGVLDLGTGQPRRSVGFVGGSRHDGTVRYRLEHGRVIVRAEAWLGGARIDPDAPRVLHPVMLGAGDDPAALLEAWATRVGAAEHARTDAPFTVGWCSWYHWFERIDEAAFRDTLARASDWPFDVFQLDDGYQAAIGDWCTPNAKFPSSLDALADAVRARRATPGLWLAPFLAAPDSAHARAHPEHLARDRYGEPLVAMFNDIWGGFVLGLDPTAPETAAHLSDLGRTLRQAGYDYAKLDFTFSPNVPGVYADPTLTPAQRVRAGYDAFRSGFGDDGFVLGCGAPLGACVGAVDALRIGPDVAPTWEVDTTTNTVWPGYEFAAPATRHAAEATVARAFMHRRLWVNDPDCVMLRTTGTDLTPEQSRAWAHTAAQGGAMVIVSDDLALLDAGHRALLDEVVTRGRAADDLRRDHAAP